MSTLLIAVASVTLAALLTVIGLASRRDRQRLWAQAVAPADRAARPAPVRGDGYYRHGSDWLACPLCRGQPCSRCAAERRRTRRW